MICAYCGTDYGDSMTNCPSCGANAAGTAKVAIERELFSHPVQASTEKSSSLEKPLRSIYFCGTLAGLALLVVVIFVAFNAGKNSVLSTAPQNSVQGAAASSDAAIALTSPSPAGDFGRESYELGAAYMEKGDLEKAIHELKKVQTDSAYYKDAQSLLETASAEYTAKVLENAQAYALTGDYASGIALLHSARNVVSSTELTTELDSAEAAYFASVVDSAKAAYFGSGAESAISVVSAGISVLPEEQRLQNLKELFEGVRDTPAHDVKHCSDLPYWWELFVTEATDSYGNEHIADILHLAYRTSDKQELEFDLYEKYSSFSAEIFVGEMTERARSGIDIYCDNRLVFSTGDVDRRYRGESVSVDLSGVYCMKIITRGFAHFLESDSNIYLENPVFHKELSEEDIDRAVQ